MEDNKDLTSNNKNNFFNRKKAKEIKLLNSSVDTYSNKVSKKRFFNGTDENIDTYFVLEDKWKVLLAQYDKKSTNKKDLLVEMRSLYKKIENQYKKIDKNHDKEKENVFNLNRTLK